MVVFFDYIGSTNNFFYQFNLFKYFKIKIEHDFIVKFTLINLTRHSK